ncbi:MAG: DUF4435 domain-containing protein [Microscillaceae bacterium]|jgi:hypothetical protein|nr:DUF4435 domain-containing protein [Microscillaceae bacterium]
MSYIEELRKSREKPQVAFQEFALSTGRFSDYLFCFWEGKDNAYYVPRIKRFTNNYHSIKCGGRAQVLAVYELIINKSEYDNYKKGFFIDRDFNEPLPPKNPPIYETPCYSIENLYVSVEVFKEILKNELHLSEVSDTAFEVCVKLFVDRQKEFHSATNLLNAWYACLIEIRNKEGLQTGAKLDDKLPKDFVEFSLSSISSNYDLEKIKLTFPNATPINEDVLNVKIVEFSSCEQRLVFRGKYEMQFLIKLIQLLLQDANNAKTTLKEKINFAFGDGSSISNEQAINIFEGYAETPESLIEYLKTIIEK